MLAPRDGFTPRVLWLSVRPGVGARFGGCFLNGLSGRGREGRLGLNCGLGGRAPGPTVCANRCCGVIDGRGVGEGSVSGEFCARDEGEKRFSARATGRKMPAPGRAVLK